MELGEQFADTQFTIGDRTIIFQHGMEKVTVRGPREERLAALGEWAAAEGMSLAPVDSVHPSGYSAPATPVRPFTIGAKVRHYTEGWAGTVAGYVGNRVRVQKSESWAEVVLPENLVELADTVEVQA